MIFKKPLDKELDKLKEKESKFIRKALLKRNSKIDSLLKEKVPKNLQNTLDDTFTKAFKLVFENGTNFIEKTYKKEEIEKDYKVGEFAVNLIENKKNLKSFSKNASKTNLANSLLSGALGIGMGALGIGIPDIIVFTSFILRSIYEISLNYGFDYNDENEKKFILLLIRASITKGTKILEINNELNYFITNGKFSSDITLDDYIKDTAKALSKELLILKFIQGIPIIGIIGGASDFIYINQINEYALLKYNQRFLENKKKKI